MPSLVTQGSPGGVFPLHTASHWQTLQVGVWWILTSLPVGESYRDWLQLRHSINLYKGLSFPFCILCMHLTGQWTFPACTYTALHGSYGVLWLTREAIFRDAMWERPCTGGSALFLFIGMGIAFWSNAVLLVTGGSQYEPSPPQLCAIVTLFIFGNWLHNSADVQKYFVLKARKGLITDGVFSRIRNPNYLGELMIMGSFAAFGWNQPMWWFPWVWMVVIWTALFYPACLAKDKSLSRYPQWAQYASATGLILPWPMAARGSDGEE